MISDSQVNELFILLGKIIHRNFRRREAGVTVGEGALLACLIDKGAYGGRAVRNCGVRVGRIANLLKATEAKGYVVRRRDEEDGRKVWVTITDAGREEGVRRKEEIVSRCKEVLERLGEEDTENILRILRKLIDFGL
ncbi:MAG: MarR family winged helix-turn-helix transcriptional regulator [Christensenellaceae bacterium]